MKIIECEQGAPEWKAARCGIPTSSNFDKIVTTKGEPSKSREKYLLQLAGESITGVSEETYQNAAMQRGTEMEPEARQAYEFISGSEVKQVGIYLTTGKFICGASPDGVIGDDGLLEIKCPSMAVHVGYLLSNALPLDYYQQVQGQLFVTKRKWCDFFSYYPGLRPLLVRVHPDKDFVKSLAIELEIFCASLKEITEKIR